MSKDTVALPELKVETQRITDILQPLLTVADGIITVPADAVEKALPEGLTLETHKAGQKFDIAYAAALYNAGGRVAVDHMVENKAVESVAYKTKIGVHSTQCMFPRTAEAPTGFGETASTKTVHGALSTPSFKVGGKSEFQAVKARIQAYAVGQKLA